MDAALLAWRRKAGEVVPAAVAAVHPSLGLVYLPIFGLVLFGSSVARIAVLACALVLVSAPFLRTPPGVARALAIDNSQPGCCGCAIQYAHGERTGRRTGAGADRR